MADTERKGEKKRSERLIGGRFRYTDDYKSVPVLGAGGRKENELVYVGKWIHILNSESEIRRIALLMRVLTAAAVLCVVGAVFVLPVPMTHKWYLPVLVFSLFPLAYQIMGVFRLPNGPDFLERVKYDKGVKRVGHSALFALIVTGLSILGLAAYWITGAFIEIEGAQPYSIRDGIYALLAAAAAGAELLTFMQFRKVRTETVENSAHRPK